MSRRLQILAVAVVLSTACYDVGSVNDADSETATDSDVDADIDTDIDADSDTDGDTDTDADTGTETGTDTGEPDCTTGENCTQEYCDQVFIPAGTYPRGSDVQPEDPPLEYSCVEYGFGDETPRHTVQLSAFCIDKYEVTYKRYEACVTAGVCPEAWTDWEIPEPYFTEYPMRYTWYEAAAAYCGWIGRRMCTEAEWERAANGPGPEKRKYPWGDDPGPLGSATLFQTTDYLTAVDAYPELASAEGVHGLAGNVLDLIVDYYALYDPPDAGVLEDPIGPESGDFRLARGGATGISTNYTTSERIIIDRDYSEDDYVMW